jgi:hypothetical protein
MVYGGCYYSILHIKIEQSEAKLYLDMRPIVCNQHPFLTCTQEALQADMSLVNKPPAPQS